MASTDAGKVGAYIEAIRKTISEHHDSVEKLNIGMATKEKDVAEVREAIARAEKEVEELQTAVEIELQSEGDSEDVLYSYPNSIMHSLSPYLCFIS